MCKIGLLFLYVPGSFRVLCWSRRSNTIGVGHCCSGPFALVYFNQLLAIPEKASLPLGTNDPLSGKIVSFIVTEAAKLSTDTMLQLARAV